MADFNLSAITSVVQPATHFFFENDKIVFTISASLLVLVTAAISRQFCQPKELKTRELKVLTEKEKFLKEKELKTRELKVLTEEEKFLKEVEKTIEETKRFIQEDRFSDRERNWLYYAWKEGAVGRYRDEWRKYIQGLRKFPDYLNILLKSEIDYSTIIFINKFLNPPEAVELIKRLQKKGKSLPFHEEDNIFLLLLVNGDFESFEALGININKGLYRACQLAIHGDRRSELPYGTCQLLRREPFYFVDWALEMGANVDSMDNIRGDPCFHLAIQSEEGMELAKHLLDKGANVNSLDKDGTTILLDQVRELGWRGISQGKGGKFRERIEFLLKHGANTEARLDGQTPFHLIIRYELPYFEFAQLLLDYSADINAASPDGETPLHDAVRERNVLKIAFLVRNCAQILPNANGETPIDLARNNPEILKYLEMTPIA